MVTVGGCVRVAVVDERVLVREMLASMWAREPRVDVVLTCGDAEDVAGRAGELDLVVVSGSCQLGSSIIEGVGVLRTGESDPDSILYRIIGWNDESAAVTGVRLTRRETQIVSGLAQGLTTGEIGSRLGISAKTVENRKQGIFRKLGVQCQAHAVWTAMESGLLRLGGEAS